MKIIRGTKDHKGVIYQKQPTGGTGRTLCQKCGGVCVQKTAPHGQPTLTCQRCGAQYGTASLMPVVKESVIPRKNKGLPRVGRR